MFGLEKEKVDFALDYGALCRCNCCLDFHEFAFVLLPLPLTHLPAMLDLSPSLSVVGLKPVFKQPPLVYTA